MSMKFELDNKGVRELLHAPELEELITNKAEAVRASAGEGFSLVASNNSQKSRTYVTVRADDPKAIRKNFKHNILLKALGASHD